MTHPLDGVRAKVDRGVEHFNEFDAELVAWLNRNPYVLVGEFKSETSRYVHKIQIRAEPPARIGVMLGDVVHNLRSALDQMIRRLAEEVYGNSPADNSRYPIWESAEDFEANLTKPAQRGKAHVLQGIPPSSDAWRLIENSQPYNSNGPADRAPLAVLDSLWNEDKHNVVFATVAVITEAPGEMPPHQPNRDVERITSREFQHGGVLEDGTEVWSFGVEPCGPNPKVDVQHEPILGIGFGEKLFRRDALPGLVGEVIRLVRAFESLFEWPFGYGPWESSERMPGR